MITGNKYYILIASIAMVLLLCMAAGSNVHAQEYEGEDTEFSSDLNVEREDSIPAAGQVITGVMDEFSTRSITVDGYRYSFCKDIMIFNTAGTLIPAKDLEAAVEVKLLRSSGCISRINVLRYAH